MKITYRRTYTSESFDDYEIDFKRKTISQHTKSYRGGCLQYHTWHYFRYLSKRLSTINEPVKIRENGQEHFEKPIVALSNEDKANHIALFTSNPEIFRV